MLYFWVILGMTSLMISLIFLIMGIVQLEIVFIGISLLILLVSFISYDNFKKHLYKIQE